MMATTNYLCNCKRGVNHEPPVAPIEVRGQHPPPVEPSTTPENGRPAKPNTGGLAHARAPSSTSARPIEAGIGSALPAAEEHGHRGGARARVDLVLAGAPPVPLRAGPCTAAVLLCKLKHHCDAPHAAWILHVRMYLVETVLIGSYYWSLYVSHLFFLCMPGYTDQAPGNSTPGIQIRS
jgi:hypothetical protein